MRHPNEHTESVQHVSNFSRGLCGTAIVRCSCGLEAACDYGTSRNDRNVPWGSAEQKARRHLRLLHMLASKVGGFSFRNEVCFSAEGKRQLACGLRLGSQLAHDNAAAAREHADEDEALYWQCAHEMTSRIARVLLGIEPIGSDDDIANIQILLEGAAAHAPDGPAVPAPIVLTPPARLWPHYVASARA